jgi:hypothetical protein
MSEAKVSGGELPESCLFYDSVFESFSEFREGLHVGEARLDLLEQILDCVFVQTGRVQKFIPCGAEKEPVNLQVEFFRDGKFTPVVFIL